MYNSCRSLTLSRQAQHPHRGGKRLNFVRSSASGLARRRASLSSAAPPQQGGSKVRPRLKPALDLTGDRKLDRDKRLRGTVPRDCVDDALEFTERCQAPRTSRTMPVPDASPVILKYCAQTRRTSRRFTKCLSTCRLPRLGRSLPPAHRRPSLAPRGGSPWDDPCAVRPRRGLCTYHGMSVASVIARLSLPDNDDGAVRRRTARATAGLGRRGRWDWRNFGRATDDSTREAASMQICAVRDHRAR